MQQATTKTLRPDEVLLCPHCGKAPDYEGSQADEFVIPNRIGAASRAPTDCGDCEGHFTCEFDGTNVVMTYREANK